MKRDIKVNFSVLEEIIYEIRKYEQASAGMEQAAGKMLSLLQENESEAITALKEIYKGFSAELKSCQTELRDLDNILSGYTNEMQSIIKPREKQKYMRVDRNDIWANKVAIEMDCNDMYSAIMRRDMGFEISFGGSEEKEARERKNYRKVEEIRREVIPKLKNKLDAGLDELDRIYNRRIIPFENKDDEYQAKANGLYDKYTNIWEAIRTYFTDEIEMKWDIIRGIWDALVDLVLGLGGLVWKAINYDFAVKVLIVTYPFNMQPKWATETIREGTSIGMAILADPTMLLEGLAQQATDAVEEEGIAYCVGYVAGDFLGGKGLGKLVEVGKVGKISKAGFADDIVDEVPNVIKKSTDGVKPPVIDITETMAEAISRAARVSDEFAAAIRTGAMYGDDVTSTVATVALDAADTNIIGRGINGIWRNNPSIVRTTLTNTDEIIAFYRRTLTDGYIDELVAANPAKFAGKNISSIKAEMAKLRAMIQKTKDAARAEGKFFESNPLEPSFQPTWLVENCAEIWAVRDAILQGSKMENIVIRSVDIADGSLKPLCKNCVETFADLIKAME